jgi:hypothetical protein
MVCPVEWWVGRRAGRRQCTGILTMPSEAVPVGSVVALCSVRTLHEARGVRLVATGKLQGLVCFLHWFLLVGAYTKQLHMPGGGGI